MTEKRVTLQCFNCPRTYTLRRDVSQAKLIVECPYCGAEGEVDLAPFREPSLNIHRGEGGGSQTSDMQLNLPDVLPTQPRST
jgi:DNA-directed RNA polymerase subunit RPC12/RpoP